MNARPPTPHAPVTQIICGRAVKEPAYTVWRPVGTDSWHLLYTNSGGGVFSTRLGSFWARQGDVVLYAPNQPQDYGTVGTEDHWDRTWVHFRPRPHWENWLQWPHHANGLRHLHLESGEIREAFRVALERMLEFSQRSLPGTLDFMAATMEEALLWANVVASSAAGMAQDERVRQAADYLAAHLREPLHSAKLAARYGLSVSRLAHLFKQQIGSTPQQFLEQRRMQHARQLLRLTNRSVTDVARAVGYDDPFYFSNRFRRHAGQSPLHFRRQR